MSETKNYPVWLVEAAERWRLRLIPQWRVRLDPEPPSGYGDGEAASQSSVNYHFVRVWINLDHDSLRGLTGEQRRRQLEESLVHELLHPLINPVAEAYNPALDAMGDQARRAVEDAAETHSEQTIEALSRALVALDRQDVPELLLVREPDGGVGP